MWSTVTGGYLQKQTKQMYHTDICLHRNVQKLTVLNVNGNMWNI